MIRKSHSYFLLPNRPWPLVCSLGGLNFMVSLNIFFKFRVSFNIILCFFFLTSCSFFWWFFYAKEFSFKGLNSFVLEEGIKASMILFISSEIFFFFSFFWGYFHFFLRPGLENGFCWPPVRVLSFDFSHVPLTNTLILLSSGVTVTFAHNLLILGWLTRFILFLFATVSLGSVFTLFQYLEYCSSFFSLRDGNYGSSFFLLTGFHGLHVIIGSIFLALSFFFRNSFLSSESNFLRFELACWYWHFVDVVWIFLFFFLYYICY